MKTSSRDLESRKESHMKRNKSLKSMNWSIQAQSFTEQLPKHNHWISYDKYPCKVSLGSQFTFNMMAKSRSIFSKTHNQHFYSQIGITKRSKLSQRKLPRLKTSSSKGFFSFFLFLCFFFFIRHMLNLICKN